MAILQTPNQLPLEFTQGDTAALQLVALDDEGNPIDVTLATFSTQILGPNGENPAQFGNSQHTVTDGPNGRFTLGLSTTDTPTCGLGEHKQILTQLTIDVVVETCRGINILTVYPEEPTQ